MPLGTLHADVAAHQFRERLHQSQSDAGAAHIAVSRLIESVEDVRHLVARDADAVVCHDEREGVASQTGGNADVPAVVSIFQRVGKQIIADALHLVEVGADGEALRDIGDDADALGGGGGHESREPLAQVLSQVEGGDVYGHFAVLHLAEVENLAHEAQHHVHVFACHLQ